MYTYCIFHSVDVDFFFLHACIRTVYIFHHTLCVRSIFLYFTVYVLEFFNFFFLCVHIYLRTVLFHIYFYCVFLPVYEMLVIFMYFVPLTIQFLLYRRCSGPKFILLMKFLYYKIYSGVPLPPVLEHTEKYLPPVLASSYTRLLGCGKYTMWGTSIQSRTLLVFSREIVIQNTIPRGLSMLVYIKIHPQAYTKTKKWTFHKQVCSVYYILHYAYAWGVSQIIEWIWYIQLMYIILYNGICTVNFPSI
jgi:hypothetical protein